MKSHVIKLIRRFAATALLVPAMALASGAGKLDKAPVSTDQAALQNGAKLFINYCLNCHGASALRYNQLQKIGLTEEAIRENLLFTGEKTGDMMQISMTRDDAEAWFGTVPPDLSVIARAKASEAGSGADYLYTYLRGFYQDPNRPTGWNNKVFDNVGMPHALWDLQGTQTARKVKATDAHGKETVGIELIAPAKPGRYSTEEYDKAVADLVSFMVWMGEPVAEKRKQIGIYVLIYLAGFYLLAHALGKNYWKDIH
ncbi:MAG: cytochrome c1 [Azoarcus sp.]|jgi:ubiquinol-cytochrome c reductase cytochrome c1 subunit|nr:cytochrome c1 [Azoarcus sp.]